MVDPELVALATTAGTAVAKAAGTDAWKGLREGVVRLFRRGHAPDAAAQVTSERLDRTAAELEQADPAGAAQARGQVAASWGTRFRDLLEELGDSERAEVVARLRELVATAEPAHGGVTAGEKGIAIGGNVEIKAEGGSVAGLQIGNVTLGNPPPPGPAQG